MGMAASQVRFLTLQDRKSTIGMRLGMLSNRKMALSRDMTKAANEYNQAFSATTLQWYDQINGEYTDITYDAMMLPSQGNNYTPYILTDRNTGNVIVDTTSGGVGEKVKDFLERCTSTSGSVYKPGSVSFDNNMKVGIITDIMGLDSTEFDPKKMVYHAVKNETVTEGGVQTVQGDQVIEMLNTGIGTLAATACESVIAYGLSEYVCNPDRFGTISTENMYYRPDGSAITRSSETWWSTLYENSAVVNLSSRFIADAGDEYIPAGDQLDIWIAAFADAVVDSDTLSTSGIDYAAVKTQVIGKVHDALAPGAVLWGDTQDTKLDFDLALDWWMKDGATDEDPWTFGGYFSDQSDDPVGGKYESTLSIIEAAAKQSNAAMGLVDTPVKYIKTVEGGEVWEKANQYWMSVKNMMDLTMYYFDLYTREGGYNVEDDYFNSNLEEAKAGNCADIINPINYKNSELKAHIQGEVSAPSMYAILSNVNMLQQKINYLDLNYWSDNLTQPNENTYRQMLNNLKEIKDYVNGFTTGTKSPTKADVIALANVNGWISDALDYDYTSDTSNGFWELSELSNRAHNASKLSNGVNWSLNGHTFTSYVSDPVGWTEYQASLSGAFYYDPPKDANHITTFAERDYLFSQSYAYGEATSEVDIEGQLNGIQLKELEFYVSLIKSCLEKGWNGENNLAANSEKLTLQLQNGRWLINDMTAKSSSKIFEVKNKAIREEALSEYESKQTELSAKEERVDIQMDQLRTEQSAISTEMDALQKIIDDNIGNTFKIFS